MGARGLPLTPTLEGAPGSPRSLPVEAQEQLPSEGFSESLSGSVWFQGLWEVTDFVWVATGLRVGGGRLRVGGGRLRVASDQGSCGERAMVSWSAGIHAAVME